MKGSQGRSGLRAVAAAWLCAAGTGAIAATGEASVPSQGPPSEVAPTAARGQPVVIANRRQADSPSATPPDTPPHTLSGTLPAVVVSGSVAGRRLDDAPYAASVIDADTLRGAGPRINLSEALNRVPGLTANNRQNYAQDLQLSTRGFGARAPFGVRGLRLYTDGIPATMPDGQGQVTHMDLASAARIEVLRGPFSALYGNSSGGVIAMVSAPVRERFAAVDLDAGSAGLRQTRLSIGSPLGGGWEAQAGVSHLALDGFRPHSAARRALANGRLAWAGERDQVLVLMNSIDQRAQDPLGLTAAQLAANPDQTAAQAEQFDTRKNARQTQLGARWSHRFDEAGPLSDTAITAYAGRRAVTQWQSITVAAQTPVGSGGGVVDFHRRYDGVDARAIWRLGEATLATGVNLERQRDDRQGHENFIGSGAAQRLGVTGALRRDEDNEAVTREAYAQLEAPITETLSASAGVRAGRVTLSAQDRFLSNGDDSGAARYRYATPALGLGWKAAPGWLLHAAVGRGFESPTLNELAYRADGQGGFNAALKPQKSTQQELGLKWRGGRGAGDGAIELDATVFHIDTRDEIGVLTNSGGRSSFQNVGRTRRGGIELAGAWAFAPRWRTQVALGTLKASYRDGFLTCTATPCAAASVSVPAGNRIAGTHAGSAYAELAWRPDEVARHGELAVEWRGVKRTAVNDLNSEWAAGYGVLNLRARHAWRFGAMRAELSARFDNVADRRYAGSVIVNDGNGRFYEPAPGRSFWLGLSLRAADGG
ncbi:TonB-dependent receptor family protein [Roseateles chitosanitabidus]|uniref:TonB-dependent receptor family protein n=1 Tax=Roseateles chitosanitabidus TaxID=65048 RepID=UPI00082D975A|nr:TonB-dependent receptor [Roseateles chitosanitabidus]